MKRSSSDGGDGKVEIKEEDAEAQTDEMTALSSILTEDEFTTSPLTTTTTPRSLISGTIRIHPTPSNNKKTFTIKVPQQQQQQANTSTTTTNSPAPGGSSDGEREGGGGGDVVSFRHLPPLSLYFSLPTDYPSQSPPTFTLSAQWIHRTKLGVLCGELDKEWREASPQPILFQWISTLRERLMENVEDEDGLVDLTWWRPPSTSSTTTSSSTTNHNQEIDNQTKKKKKRINKIKGGGGGLPKNFENLLDPRGVFESPTPASVGEGVDLVQFLLRYDAEREAQVFASSYHSCSICFSEKPGVDSFGFDGCGHTFCKTCLLSYFTELIHAAQPVTCPQVECKSEAHPHEILSIVGQEEFERYDRILLNRSLDSMQDIFYCPRTGCGAPLIADSNEGKLGVCVVCSYSFCLSCKSVYHGVQPCRFKAQERDRVCREYRGGSLLDRERLEKQFGRRPLALLLEAMESEEWIEKSSKKCPHCSVPIQKFEGCNKVTCSKCHTYFCWICQAQLSTNNPYFHFNNPQSACFNNLFRDDDEDEDDENEDVNENENTSSSEEEEEDQNYFALGDEEELELIRLQILQLQQPQR